MKYEAIITEIECETKTFSPKQTFFFTAHFASGEAYIRFPVSDEDVSSFLRAMQDNQTIEVTVELK